MGEEVEIGLLWRWLLYSEEVVVGRTPMLRWLRAEEEERGSMMSLALDPPPPPMLEDPPLYPREERR